MPQGSVLGPLLYLLYTVALHNMADSTTATFADDTAVLTAHEDPAIATHRLQIQLTFRHRASCILGQGFHYSPENAFYIFNQQIYFIN